jgi:pimeloyl-ACP methyl ester carboxylesterase
MKRLRRSVAMTLLIAGFASTVTAQEVLQLGSGSCPTTSILHCPDDACPSPVVINQGTEVEMKTRRTYFLDYPCDLKKGEPITLILSLHGGGSYGNWQRHYFPLMDYRDRYRLVIATPNSPIRVWTEADDEYLRNIVDSLIEQLGRPNIKAFWLVGHSQGGMTSNRLVRTEYFSRKVDGWLSLSGGRLGGNPDRSAGFNAVRISSPTRATPGLTAGSLAAAAAALASLPSSDFSHIYATGQREIVDSGVPEVSDWAKKFGCGPRGKPQDVTDVKSGYVFDSTRLNQLNGAWGLLPAAGKSQISIYPGCREGRVVADVVRLDKGHTEGLEPKITEELIKLMLSAPGGKIQRGG